MGSHIPVLASQQSGTKLKLITTLVFIIGTSNYLHTNNKYIIPFSRLMQLAVITATFDFEFSKDTDLSIIASSVNVFLIFSNGQCCDIFVVTLNFEKYSEKMCST